MTATITRSNTRVISRLRNLLYGSLALLCMAPVQAEQINTVELFDFACRHSHVSCVNVPMPNIVLTWMGGLWGAYSTATPDTVWIEFNLLYGPAFQLKEVIVHEMVHYLDYTVRSNPMNSIRSVCASEARAWAIGNKWLEFNGYPQLVEQNWQRLYPQCSKR